MPTLPWRLLATPDGAGLSRESVCELLGQIEDEVSRAPAECFSLADGIATLRVRGHSYHAGRFEVPTLAMLEQRVRATPPAAGGQLRLSILRGTGSATDIGSLQANAPSGALFQVASQFNCLEAPGRRVTAIRAYPHDPTQGPRASVSAFPGTFLRHYFAPRDSGERFVQTDDDAINLLGDVLDPATARVKSGYLTTDQITDANRLATALEENFRQIRVGVHDDVQVALGFNWGGAVANEPRIAQAFTSTIALGMYSYDDGSPALAIVRRQLLRAAYLGTLLAAIALGKRIVVLTLIGGGAFGNPHRAIWDAIHWAIAEATPHVHGAVDVVVNTRSDIVEDADLARAVEVIEVPS